MGKERALHTNRLSKAVTLVQYLGKLELEVSLDILQEVTSNTGSPDTMVIYSWNLGSLEMLSRFSAQNISCLGDKVDVHTFTLSEVSYLCSVGL